MTSAGFGKCLLKQSKDFRFLLSNQKLARARTSTPKAMAPKDTSCCLATSETKTVGSVPFSEAGFRHHLVLVLPTGPLDSCTHRNNQCLWMGPICFINFEFVSLFSAPITTWLIDTHLLSCSPFVWSQRLCQFLPIGYVLPNHCKADIYKPVYNNCASRRYLLGVKTHSLVPLRVLKFKMTTAVEFPRYLLGN